MYYNLKKLNLITSLSNEAAENLSLEEALLLHSSTDFLLFYVNEASVILGKHQNPWLEVNLPYASSHGIPVRRRLSGGGTVFHDLGNVNFAFIRSVEGDLVNFSEHIKPISTALQVLGISNRITERNDVFYEDFKLSGNAEHINNAKRRVLHHGTLLYDSNLEMLRKVLIPTKNLPITTHAVTSKRSSVKNIREIKDLGSITEFIQLLIVEIQRLIPTSEALEIRPLDNAYVQQLVEENTQRTPGISTKLHSFNI